MKLLAAPSLFLFFPSTLATASALAPLRPRQTISPSPFTPIAAHSGSPVHLLPVNAAHGKFWLGGLGANTYCPTGSGIPCVNTSATVLSAAAGVNKLINLYAISPGGQDIYVTSNGTLTFTAPHEESIFPPGTATGTFTYTPGRVGALSFDNATLGVSGFVACPTGGGEGYPYQVYVPVEGGEWGECVGFQIITSAWPKDGPVAFEYL